jgi:hypothetical protein
VKELSPAAQAAWTAYETADCDPYFVDPRKAGLAAALRAVVNQVVPDIGYEADCLDEPVMSELQCIRNRFFAIADELEGHA